MGSRAKTTRSARLPTSSEPTSFSRKSDQAASRVKPRRASSRVSRSPGSQPPAGLPCEVLAGHRGVEAEPRVGRLHREVAAQGQPAAGVQHLAPGVGPLQPARAQALVRPGHVGGGVGRLHGGDDAEPRHALDVLHAHHLRVLQAEARLRAAGRRAPAPWRRAPPGCRGRRWRGCRPGSRPGAARRETSSMWSPGRDQQARGCPGSSL